MQKFEIFIPNEKHWSDVCIVDLQTIFSFLLFQSTENETNLLYFLGKVDVHLLNGTCDKRSIIHMIGFSLEDINLQDEVGTTDSERFTLTNKITSLQKTFLLFHMRILKLNRMAILLYILCLKGIMETQSYANHFCSLALTCTYSTRYHHFLLLDKPSLPPATKLGQGNIFSSMCQEFCPQLVAAAETRTVGKRAVRILLECFLVVNITSMQFM